MMGELPPEPVEPVEPVEPGQPQENQVGEQAPEGEEVEQFDYDQMVPMPDGADEISVSALKNEVIDARRRSVEIDGEAGPVRIKVDELKEKYNEYQRNEYRIREQQLEVQNEKRLVDIARRNGGQLSSEDMAQLQQIERGHVEREAATMFERHPEWKNEGVFAQARDAMHKTAKAYGMQTASLNSINDAAVVEMLYDLTKYRERHEGVQLVKGRVTKTQKAGSRVARKEARNKRANVNSNSRRTNARQAQW